MPKRHSSYNAREKALTPLEKNFCHEYPVDFNQTRAALRAGYKGNEKTAANWASQVVRKPKVQEYLSKLAIEREKRTGIKSDAHLKKLVTLTNANIGDYFAIDSDGNLKFKDISIIDPELLLGLTFTREKKGNDEVVSIALSDKLRVMAFNALNRHHKIVGDVNVSLDGDDLDKLVVLASKFDAAESEIAAH